MRLLKTAGKAILILVLFVASFSALTQVVAEWGYKNVGKITVLGENIPERFPVLVLTRESDNEAYRAKTVYYSDLKSYLQEKPNYTFLVPPGEEDRLNFEIKQDSRVSQTPLNLNFASPDPWHASFEVSHISDARQALEVNHTWDDDRVNTSWYEATSKEIFPQQYQFYFAPAVELPAAIIAFVTNCFLWVLVFVVYARRHRNNAFTA